MKNSKIDWIGDVPQKWKTIRLRYLGSLYGGMSNKKPEDFGFGTPFINYKSIYKNIVLPTNVEERVNATQNDILKYSVKYGDTFFTGSSETIEELGLSSTCLKDYPNATFNGFCIRFRPYSFEKYVPEFMKYYFRSEAVRTHLVAFDNSITRTNLSQDKLKDIVVLLPPHEEQILIAKFLDKKCLEIDSAITKTKQSIEEYKKLKQSIITEAVTKGLNHNVEKKDSGNFFVGSIPMHWTLNKMNRICNVITDYVASGSFAALAENVTYLDYPDYAMLIRTADVSGKGHTSQPVYIDEDSYNFLHNSNLFGGEIILPNIGAVGDVYIVPKLYEKMSLAPNSIMVKTNQNDMFFYYFFASNTGRKMLLDLAQSTAQAKFNKTQLRQMKVPEPPLLEQEEIARYLDDKCTKIDALIEYKFKLIKELQSYKKSLIYEYVTGKKEVPSNVD